MNYIRQKSTNKFFKDRKEAKKYFGAAYFNKLSKERDFEYIDEKYLNNYIADYELQKNYRVGW